MDPAFDIIELALPPSPLDSQIPNAFNSSPFVRTSGTPQGWSSDGNVWYVQEALAGMFGYKIYDTFFTNMHLKNGWTAYHAQAICFSRDCVGNAAGAYVASLRPGTDSPYVSVRVWNTPNTWVTYLLHVWIVGPKGIPYQ